MPEIQFSRVEQSLKIPDKVAKFVNLHTRSGDYMRNMFSEQFGYGHREILLKYCGLDFSTQLLGNLQHGVMFDHLFLDFRTPRYLGMRKSKFWVFSKEYEKLGRSLGNKNVIAIGAPWLYLRDSVEKEPQQYQKAEGILVMPGHSSGPYASLSSVAEKKKRAKAFRQIVGTQKATVCLHATDFSNPDTTEAFLDEGFRVICVGSSNTLPFWTEAGNRIRTLYKLMSLMNSHTQLLTDRQGTHVFYAINMGLEIGIFPEINKFSRLNDLSGIKGLPDDAFYKKEEMIYLTEKMPEMLNQFTESGKYIDISNEVLGRNAVMCPEDLLEVLDYRKNVYPISGIQPW